jgi:hypothetical protein
MSAGFSQPGLAGNSLIRCEQRTSHASAETKISLTHQWAWLVFERFLPERGDPMVVQTPI